MISGSVGSIGQELESRYPDYFSGVCSSMRGTLPEDTDLDLISALSGIDDIVTSSNLPDNNVIFKTYEPCDLSVPKISEEELKSMNLSETEYDEYHRLLNSSNNISCTSLFQDDIPLTNTVCNEFAGLLQGSESNSHDDTYDDAYDSDYNDGYEDNVEEETEVEEETDGVNEQSDGVDDEEDVDDIEEEVYNEDDVTDEIADDEEPDDIEEEIDADAESEDGYDWGTDNYAYEDVDEEEEVEVEEDIDNNVTDAVSIYSNNDDYDNGLDDDDYSAVDDTEDFVDEGYDEEVDSEEEVDDSEYDWEEEVDNEEEIVDDEEEIVDNEEEIVDDEEVDYEEDIVDDEEELVDEEEIEITDNDEEVIDDDNEEVEVEIEVGADSTNDTDNIPTHESMYSSYPDRHSRPFGRNGSPVDMGAGTGTGGFHRPGGSGVQGASSFGSQFNSLNSSSARRGSETEDSNEKMANFIIKISDGVAKTPTVIKSALGKLSVEDDNN